MLNLAIHSGKGHQRRLVFAHGFTQAGGVWCEFATRFADLGFEVLAPDLPGHGKTDEKYDNVDLWEAGRLLGEVGGQATYVGYSLGGRTLLHLAIRRPELVDGMVLVGAKVGFASSAEASARKQSDDAMADRIEALATGGNYDTFIDEWLQHPVNIRLPQDATHRDLRLRNRPQGVAASLRYCGSGVQDPLWEHLADLTMPVLVAYAEFDTPVILHDNLQLAEAIGENAVSKEFANVGHSIPFEDPNAFSAALVEFLRV